MANSLTAFVDWVAMEALRVLKNKLVVAEIFDTSYIPDYQQSFAVGQTIRIPLPQRYVVTSGLGYQGQPISNQVTTATIDQIKGVHFAWNSFEQATTLQRGDERMRKDFIEAPMAAIAQEIDTKAAIFATQNTNNIVGVLGTNPTSMQTFNQARARLVENACPPGMEDQRMIISPGMNVTLGNALSSVFNPQTTISDVFNDGMLGKGAGFGRWYESMSLRSTTASTWAGTVEVTNAGDGTLGTLVLTCTTGDTFAVGDVFSVEGVYNVNPQTRQSTGTLKQFVITQATTGASSTATINFSPAMVGPGATPTDGQYQNVSALPAAGADLTLYPGTTSPNGKSGTNGLAIHKQAFALVGVPLPIPPTGGPMISASKRDPQTGLSVSFIRWFDGNAMEWKTRYDVAFGFGALYPDNCAVRVLGA